MKRVLQTGFPAKAILADFLGLVADLSTLTKGQFFGVTVSNREPPVGGLTKASSPSRWGDGDLAFWHLTPFG